MKNNIHLQSKFVTKHQNPMDLSKGHRYQKSDLPPDIMKNNHSTKNPFDRNHTRRSLGADVAPQFDIQDYGALRNTHSSTCFDSDSLVSDFSDAVKPVSTQRPVVLRKIQIKSNEFEKDRSRSKSVPSSPTKPTIPPRSPHTPSSMLNVYNVRTIGNKINLSIVKKPTLGLGFTIVTRDNQVQYGSAADIANSVVILVNKILPNGGAAEGNLLRAGDRLLEVNGVPVSSLRDATDKLRAISENGSVNLLISRIDTCESPPKEEHTPTVTSQSTKKQITFEIPLNRNSKEKEQLGLNILSLCEKDNPSTDNGIYIHSILDNSLASQQGGLKVDDKIIGINGHSLNGLSVKETISQLKRAMLTDAVLAITVCRAILPEQLSHSHTVPSREHNHYPLTGRLAVDTIGRPTSYSRSTADSSHISSADSLSPHNRERDEPDTSTSFVRDSKGRRSMSDKRKAHEDASQYTFYKETRVGDPRLSDASDRLYSTMPTASHLKKMRSNQAPALPNKTQGPVKPSQIKQLNTPKTQADQNARTPKIVDRSSSLRNSQARAPPSNPSPSPKCASQTPSIELQPTFNRAMNNSFKKAVHKSLPVTGRSLQNINSIDKSHITSRKELASVPLLNTAENSNPVHGTDHSNKQIPRSNSVKSPNERTKNFNFKSFLNFIPTVSRGKSITSKEKSDTFPLNEHPRYQVSSTNSNAKHHSHSAAEIIPPVHNPVDPVIIGSKKRVLEWQKKNDDVISKDNKVLDQKVYHTISTYGTVDSKKKKSKPFSISMFACWSTSDKGKTDVIMGVRSTVSKRSTFPISRPDTDPYDTIDGTLSSATRGARTTKSSQSKTTTHTHSHSHTGHTSLKHGGTVASSKATKTHRIPSPTKVTPANDIYATINKAAKSPKQSSNTSQTHTNKYRF